MLDVECRDDMFNWRMLLLRVVSGYSIYYGMNEIMKEPDNLD